MKGVNINRKIQLIYWQIQFSKFDWRILVSCDYNDWLALQGVPPPPKPPRMDPSFVNDNEPTHGHQEMDATPPIAAKAIKKSGRKRAPAQEESPAPEQVGLQIVYLLFWFINVLLSAELVVIWFFTLYYLCKMKSCPWKKRERIYKFIFLSKLMYQPFPFIQNWFSLGLWYSYICIVRYGDIFLWLYASMHQINLNILYMYS